MWPGGQMKIQDLLEYIGYVNMCLMELFTSL